MCLTKNITNSRLQADKINNDEVRNLGSIGNLEIININNNVEENEWEGYINGDSLGGSVLNTSTAFLLHDDLKPVNEENCTWGSFNFIAFWISDSFSISTWMIASTGIISGLKWWQVWIMIWLGYLFSGIFVVLTGKIGSKYHISFPVCARASFGIYGVLWPIINRVIISCIWYGVQAWIGGNCVKLMLLSVINTDDYKINSYTKSITGYLPIPVPDSVNTLDFASFLLFWVISLPAIWFPVHQIKHLFTIKTYVVPLAGLVFLFWTLYKAGGVGPIFKQPTTVSGVELWWKLISVFMTCIANFATMIVNNPDFSRFSKKESCSYLPQLFAIPFGFAITSLIGILVSSSSTILFNKTIWSPLDVLELFLQENTLLSRVGVFFISNSFALAQLGTNIAANSVSAGTDMTALMPRYINVRRGSYICAFIGLLIKPWELVRSSSRFTYYLSSYSVFLSSIAGVIISDYYLVRKEKLFILDLYSLDNKSIYKYNMFGISLNAYMAYLFGLLINMPGFLRQIFTFSSFNSPLFIYIYRFSYFSGFISSALFYFLLSKFLHVKIVPSDVSNTSRLQQANSIMFKNDDTEALLNSDSDSARGSNSYNGNSSIYGTCN